ncbi:MAG: STAS domain-containing protein [Ferruginibacter sp.]
MNIKLDTKEKFRVLRIQEDTITENLSAEFHAILDEHSATPPHNLILDFTRVRHIADAGISILTAVYGQCLEKGISMVIFGLQKEVIQSLQEKEMDDLLNITPTESEAMDIVQMEEIERELLKDHDVE